jgi:diguanylate cyclase (GGDEF)-like protein/putative nucleotidyltransferase with HDIG domain
VFGAGIVVFWLSDSVYLIENSLGTYQNGGPFDMGWWFGLALVALAAWQPSRRCARQSAHAERPWAIALPVVFVAIATGVLAYGALRPTALNLGGLGLAIATIAAVAVRLVLTFRASLRLLRAVRAESVTDSLTGLPNRRALTTALKASVTDATGGGPTVVLALFDLDGFKNYNDAFGHQAGDALLARLGATLARAVGGRGYRMGGDEFCVLLTAEPTHAASTLETAAQALSEHGEGFSVTASWGSVIVPAEADTAEDALRIADQRMYAHKNGGRPSPSRQSTDVLLRALAERYPELDDHSLGVASLAEQTARVLGLDHGEVEAVRLAAELHDVGKVAIPETILNKPGPLDDLEWEYMRRHSVIGERIIAAAPSLQRVAKMVRASHERFDGGGYPDGLAGEDVPLGARIVAVCDAYDAMVTARPYSPAQDIAAALAELQRCAGAQFDPVVVEAFCEVLTRAPVVTAPR